MLRASTHITQQIGKLGTMNIVPGFYVYVGSAFGPGGLRARIAHHLKTTIKPHWHIDYLRCRTTPVEVWVTRNGACLEHQWARTLSRHVHAAVPLRGFGASDCTCDSHLFFFPEEPSYAELEACLPGTIHRVDLTRICSL